MSLQNTLGTADAERADIDAQIQQLKSQILGLQSRRNRLSPIARLPPELLCRIFLCYRDSVTGTKTEQNRQEYRLSLIWIRVTHVCREWRSIALGCAQLWSNIAFYPCRWPAAFLERSKQAPLSIRISAFWRVFESSIYDMVKSTLANTSRLKSLHLGEYFEMADEDESLSLTRVLCSTSAPILESLTLTNISRPTMLPPHFLEGGAPNLRYLNLAESRLPWDSSLFRSLTTLIIESSELTEESIPLPSPTEILSALASIPELRRLELVIPLPALDTFSGHRPIHLRRLEILRLGGRTLDGCVGLLQCLRLPSSAALAFSFERSRFGAQMLEAVPAFHPAITSAWLSDSVHPDDHAASPRSLRAIFIERSFSSVAIQAWQGAIDFGDSNCNGANNPPTPSIVWRLPRNGEILNLLLQTPLFTTVDSVRCDHDRRDETMLRIGELPSLKSLSISGAAAFESFLKVVNFDVSHSEISYFRSLEYLSLEGVKFGYSWALEEGHMRSIDIPTDALLDFLMLRYELGGEIRKLRLKKCRSLWKQDVERLKQVIVDIDWDEDSR